MLLQIYNPYFELNYSICSRIVRALVVLQLTKESNMVLRDITATMKILQLFCLDYL